MGEIEHFVDPEDKSHEKFREVRDTVLSLLDRHVQVSGSTQVTQMTIGEAVDKGIVANETLGYFLVRINLFLIKIGINPKRLRFRQHMANEMAHYAADCWDAEIENATGWTECVGCADRAAYDLSVHSARTGQPLVVRQALKEPIVTEKEVPEFNKKVVGKTYGRDAGPLQKVVGEMDESQLTKLKGELAQGSVSPSVPYLRRFTRALCIAKRQFLPKGRSSPSPPIYWRSNARRLSNQVRLPFMLWVRPI
jgi:glycyl-tRNA synthetase